MRENTHDEKCAPNDDPVFAQDTVVAPVSSNPTSLRGGWANVPPQPLGGIKHFEDRSQRWQNYL